MRINKYLASAGLASRRKAEELVKAGKVKVNGKVLTNLATDIKDTDSVVVEGKSIKNTTNFVYYKLNKPKGYITTVDDEKGRKTVMSLLRGVHYRVFPVGRLDYDTEGLLLFTNDGDITNILTKPAREIEKTYVATIEG
ncbi:MAG: pseudouridine synthase, partial [Clostridia bacterium]|nr:pseudouridine synthase [Clostridia bacterium]